MKAWLAIAGAAFILLHHDFWLWADRSLWLGFLPAGLGYHALYSLAAAGLWALACRYAWPEHIEAWARELSSGLPGEGPEDTSGTVNRR
ncbi:MAG TPA: hypothetical protein VMN36_17450 [Verrucomicrobiales bacterium]|nr:hypothetical protein [Verrucomicrobiales bacterium]